MGNDPRRLSFSDNGCRSSFQHTEIDFGFAHICCIKLAAGRPSLVPPNNTVGKLGFCPVVVMYCATVFTGGIVCDRDIDKFRLGVHIAECRPAALCRILVEKRIDKGRSTGTDITDSSSPLRSAVTFENTVVHQGIGQVIIDPAKYRVINKFINSLSEITQLRHVIAYDAKPDINRIRQLLKAGVNGYLFKKDPAEEPASMRCWQERDLFLTRICN